MIAYESGHLDLIESLIRGYNLSAALNQKNKRGDSLLSRAIKDQNDFLICLLLESPKIDINACDEVYTVLVHTEPF